MRRTITLLLLLLCCTCAARAQDAGGQPPDNGEAKKNYGAAVKKLRDVAAERQGQQEEGEAKRLNDDIVNTLGARFRNDEDFASDDKLKEITPKLADWSNTANDRSKNIPRRDLVKAIEAAVSASGAYLPGGGDELDDKARVKATPTPSIKSLAEEVARLRTQVDAQAGILPEWASLGLMLLMPLLALASFAFLFFSLHQARQDLDNLTNLVNQGLISLRNRQDGFSKQAEGLAASNADLFARLAELSAEIGAVDGRVRGLKTAPAAMTERSDGDGRRMPPPPPEPPAFPISADAYLRKMQRHATVVKPDFQNGILVADSENNGELVLVQDTSISHDTLFVVPRAAQFQMKQDFYTYYERYYECERPASGTVWIVDPAVVERVQGGWELREKGVLEVR